jgi:hypothetical protein
VSRGPNIACCRCGARPYPELGLPETVRETFDLIKLKLVMRDGGKWWTPADENEGQWFCELHRRKLGGDRFSVAEAAS